MAHEMTKDDSSFYGGRQPAWHGLGNVIDADVITAADAIRESGLGWRVIKSPLVTVPTFDGDEWEIDVPEFCATIREDTRKVLGVVGTGYEVVQNDELMDFVAALCDTHEAIFHTAGSMRGGKIVWALAKFPRTIQILGQEDETIQPFILASNAHDGTRALTAAVTPVRVVCMNTLTIALSRAIRTWSIRHTRNAKDRIVEAQEALGIAFKYMDAFEKASSTLVRAKMTKKEFSTFLETLIPYDPEMVAMRASGGDSRAARNVDEAHNAIQTLFLNSPNLQNVKGTKWAALNAVGEWIDHTKDQRAIRDENGEIDERAMAERRFIKSAWDNTTKQKALRLLDPKLAHQKGDNLLVAANS